MVELDGASQQRYKNRQLGIGKKEQLVAKS